MDYSFYIEKYPFLNSSWMSAHAEDFMSGKGSITHVTDDQDCKMH
jgi:hypothetical protein